jgi:hypothetical protein
MFNFCSGGLVHTSLKEFRFGSQIKRSVSAGTCSNLRPLKLSALTIHLFRVFLFFVQFLSSSSSLGICIASWASGKGSSDFLSPFLLVGPLWHLSLSVQPSPRPSLASSSASANYSFLAAHISWLDTLGLRPVCRPRVLTSISIETYSSATIKSRAGQNLTCQRLVHPREHCSSYSAPPDPRFGLGLGFSPT